MPAGTFDPHACRANAERFSAARFRSAFSRFVLEGYAALQAELSETMQGGPLASRVAAGAASVERDSAASPLDASRNGTLARI